MLVFGAVGTTAIHSLSKVSAAHPLFPDAGGHVQLWCAAMGAHYCHSTHERQIAPYQGAAPTLDLCLLHVLQ